MSVWISISLSLVFIFSLGEYEMISASSFVFACLLIIMIYVNVYHLIMKINAGIDVSELKYFKYIPISMIGIYHGVVLNDMIMIILSKNSIIETLNVYNINNYKFHQDELDAESLEDASNIADTSGNHCLGAQLYHDLVRHIEHMLLTSCFEGGVCKSMSKQIKTRVQEMLRNTRQPIN